MGLPDFIGIGAQKSGTTWLHEALRQHPSISMASHRKEVHFFDRYYDRGTAWYESLFPSRPGCQAGEITPAYMFEPQCAELIHQLVPRVKLVAILRNPVERAYSQFRDIVRNTGDRRGFDEFVKQDSEPLERGLYHPQLQRYLALFPRSQMKVLLFEEMMSSPADSIQDLFAFLEVDPSFAPQNTQEKVNASRIPRFHSVFVLAKRLSARLHDSNLSWVVGALKKLGAGAVFQSSRAAGPAPMTPEFRQDLHDYYRADVQALSELLQKDLLTFWKFQESSAPQPKP